jgi:hypothetical protein
VLRWPSVALSIDDAAFYLDDGLMPIDNNENEQLTAHAGSGLVPRITSPGHWCFRNGLAADGRLVSCGIGRFGRPEPAPASPLHPPWRRFCHVGTGRVRVHLFRGFGASRPAPVRGSGCRPRAARRAMVERRRARHGPGRARLSAALADPAAGNAKSPSVTHACRCTRRPAGRGVFLPLGTQNRGFSESNRPRFASLPRAAI